MRRTLAALVNIPTCCSVCGSRRGLSEPEQTYRGWGRGPILRMGENDKAPPGIARIDQTISIEEQRRFAARFEVCCCPTSVIGGTAENVCSLRVLPVLTRCGYYAAMEFKRKLVEGSIRTAKSLGSNDRTSIKILRMSGRSTAGNMPINAAGQCATCGIGNERRHGSAVSDDHSRATRGRTVSWKARSI